MLEIIKSMTKLPFLNSPHYGEIDFNNDCFIVKEVEETSETEWNMLCKMFGLVPDKTYRIVVKGKVEYFGVEERYE